MKTQRSLLCCATLASVVWAAGCVITPVAQQPSPDASMVTIPQRDPAEKDGLTSRNQPVSEVTCPWQLQVERQMYSQVPSANGSETPIY